MQTSSHHKYVDVLDVGIHAHERCICIFLLMVGGYSLLLRQGKQAEIEKKWKNLEIQRKCVKNTVK
jgi:acyl-CoA synthetase (AMP-forming)/AMP-acid ligase II